MHDTVDPADDTEVADHAVVGNLHDVADDVVPDHCSAAVVDNYYDVAALAVVAGQDELVVVVDHNLC